MEPITILSQRIEGDRLVVELAVNKVAFETGRRCANCNSATAMVGKRADAKFCSANCRQQAHLAKLDQTS